ncbi:hypothetical protein [Salinicoccus sp. HZC-1]|uniref:hypothetical protein n=1 Tax=Salinicoccus sp. HZC-1 TaxID=3385497 RepID=UPI00398AA113
MMKTIDVPIKSISDVKRSPMNIFKEADEKQNGVYIFNRDSIAGVMLTQKQYEDMSNEIELLYDKIDELVALQRINDDTPQTYSDYEVRGEAANAPVIIDENDGWE